MKKRYPLRLRPTTYILIIFYLTIGSFNLTAQIGFGKGDLNFNVLGNVSTGVTSLMFGPDGRLYVAEYPGTLKVLSIQRNGQNDYVVTAIENLAGIKDIVNHNDDGTINPEVTNRQTTGLIVAGTSNNPIIYATSSDFRMGAGVDQGDVDLDTNSGILTRFSWNGSSWDVVDLVRGLPRSEENHATNGLEYVQIKGQEYLIVALGGNTNAGAPSNNFAFLCEYALSSSVIAVNLDMLNGMNVKTDSQGRAYIYDLPTLDDPVRPNVNGITDPNDTGYNGVDINDPFGGNDGLNMAVIVPGGPVQILSPGYRNPYDLVVTENGSLYVSDNGANGGWGGLTINEGTPNPINDYDPSEPGSTTSINGEKVDNKDHLQLVTTDLQNYIFGSTYGGHPNPIRANPYGAGLYTAPEKFGTNVAVFRTQVYDPNGSTPGSTTNAQRALPANWPPVSVANPVEGDWRGPGTPNPDGENDNNVTLWSVNTNGLDEYSATNFNGAMQGNLIAGDNQGRLKRVELNEDGSLLKLTQPLLTGIGGNALGISCNSDSDNFPGTIWAGTLNGKIVVFEPSDYQFCINQGQFGFDPLADYDNDGYMNQDELDNGSPHCNGNLYPSDHDRILGPPYVSDLNDPDDDADAIPDSFDPFQLGDPTTSGSDAFILPISNDFFATQNMGGYKNLGFTGVMNNGATGPNWVNWIDRTGAGPNPNDSFDETTGTITLQINEGTALGSSNNQEKGFQYGIRIDQNTGKVRVMGKLMGFHGPLQLYGNSAAPQGELGFFIGDGFQDDYIKYVITKQGFTVLQENSGVPETPVNISIPIEERPQAALVFYFLIDPTNGQIDFEYEMDGGSRKTAATMLAKGNVLKAIQQENLDLAVGIIGSSHATGVELEGTWDFLNVLPEISGFSLRINAGGPQYQYNGKLFEADHYFNGGQPFQNPNAQTAALFQTERTSSSLVFDYAIPLENGLYNVVLHFAEIYWNATGGASGAVGSRIFDVLMEGSTILDDFDILAETEPETPISKSFEVSVTDGELNLGFTSLAENGGVNQPKISAIEITGITNQSPTAVASANPISGTVPLEVHFTGSNSTDAVQVVRYQWDFMDGSPVSVLANPVHTYTTPGIYDVVLTVENTQGLTDIQSLRIQVSEPINQPPVAIASALPSNGTAPLVVSFLGQDSTDDEGITAYTWDFKDDTPVSNQINPIHTFSQSGIYQVELSVMDMEGLLDTTTVTVSVSAPINEPPTAVAQATPAFGNAPLVVLFDGSESFDDVGIASYYWDFNDGTTSIEIKPEKTFTSSGNYTVSLTVTDEDGLTHTAITTIAVNTPTNQAPVAIATASSTIGTIPFTVNFFGGNSTDDKDVVGFQWYFLDGTPISNAMDTDYTFTEQGTFTIVLEVTDAEGLTDITTLSVLVKNGQVDAPLAIISANPARGNAPLEVTFSAENSVPFEKITKFLWRFNEANATSAEITTTHVFNKAGIYEVTLTVFNGIGMSHTTTVSIVVLLPKENQSLNGNIMVNPAKDIASVQLIDLSDENRSVSRIYIHDLSGRLVGLFSPQDIYAHGVYEIPIATLGQGSLYFIGFEMDNGEKITLELLVAN